MTYSTRMHIAAAFGIFLSSISASLFAQKFYQANLSYVAIADAFGSGVFLGAALIHLIPDAAGEMLALCENDVDDNLSDDCYPYGHLCVLIGVLLVPITEEVTVATMNKRNDNSGYHRHKNIDSDANSADELPHCEEINLVTMQHDHDTGHNHDWTSISNRNTVVAVVLLFALSFHSVLAGIALGVKEDIAPTLIAILAHKSVASFALASNFLRAKVSSRAFMLVVFAFSLVTPFGCFLGVIFSTTLSPTITSGLVGLAGGAFLYTGLTQLAQTSEGQPVSKLVTLIVSAVGSGCMAVLALWT